MKHKNSKSLIKAIAATIVTTTRKKMRRLRDLIVRRSKDNHEYQNQSWKLTNNLTGFYAGDKIEFYSEDYGLYVVDHYNQNWVKEASDFYLQGDNKW